MATVKLSPIGNGTTFFTATGAVNANGFLSTYQAGTSTAVATYNSSTGTVQNGTSIQLGADGRPASEIWIVAGTAVKFVLEDSSGNPISNATWDNISGINDDTGLGVFWCGTATGTANALVLTPATPATAYTAGVIYYFKSSASANTSSATVNISGLGAIAIQLNGAALTGGEIQASTWYQLLVDATTTAVQLSNIGFPTKVNLNETFSGNVSVGGTLGVTGATTLAAVSATTGTLSGALSSTKTSQSGYTRLTPNYSQKNNVSEVPVTAGTTATVAAPNASAKAVLIALGVAGVAGESCSAYTDAGKTLLQGLVHGLSASDYAKVTVIVLLASAGASFYVSASAGAVFGQYTILGYFD